ncbi:hypothetical protein [Fortiea contorta]|uniref:hypothetical protein n=1 Tax=Fortiea contorta TaxID=1892405 RepID=UPI0003488255|nr:hypothetical protein [Fortiea contorta]
MKVKLLKILTVCLVTLVVLSPVIVVFNVVWGKHIDLVKTQSLACDVDQNCDINDALTTQLNNHNFSQEETGLSNSLHTPESRQLTIIEQYQLAIILQSFFLLIPIFFGVGIIIYDRYLVYRAAIFQEQVEMLERLWQQGIEK